MDFHISGVKQTKTKNETNYEIGQILVSGALDQTKKIRKTAVDIFAKSGPEKPRENRTKIKIFSGIFPNVPVDLAQILLNPRTNGWAPF